MCVFREHPLSKLHLLCCLSFNCFFQGLLRHSPLLGFTFTHSAQDTLIFPTTFSSLHVIPSGSHSHTSQVYTQVYVIQFKRPPATKQPQNLPFTTHTFPHLQSYTRLALIDGVQLPLPAFLSLLTLTSVPAHPITPQHPAHPSIYPYSPIHSPPPPLKSPKCSTIQPFSTHSSSTLQHSRRGVRRWPLL